MTKYISITRKKDRLREKLNAMVPGINDAINSANEKSATELVAGIKAAAPELTGDYKDHLNARPVNDGAGRIDQVITTTFRAKVQGGARRGQTISRTARAANTLAWGIFAIFWWRALEFGSRGKPAQPHIFPIYRVYRKRIRSRNSREINKQIKRVAK